MRKIYVTAFVLLLPFLTHAQYIPNSAQNFHYAPLYNPAFTGIENFVDLKFGYRYQWIGFKDNAPQFGNLSVNFRIKQPLDLRSNALRPSRTDFSKIVPRRKLSMHGLGFNVFSETFGPIVRTGGGLNYAIHMPVSEKIFISAGAGAMIENTRVDESKLYWGPEEYIDKNDPVYKRVMAGGANHTEVWGRAGLLIYGENFYVGGTYYPYNTTLKSSDMAFSDAYYRAGIQAGVSFPLDEEFDLKPSIWGLMLTTNKWVIDYSAKFYMQDRVWFGLTYRDIKSGIVSGGLNVSQLFSVSYSFEFPLGELRTYGGSSHELIMAFRFNNVRHVNQRTW
jgi:type IX secretion system PorP/SprF family membrane protein